MATWKGKGRWDDRKLYPPWVWKGKWMKQKCVVCGVSTGAAIPERFAVEVMCFGCPTQPDELAKLRG
tara:strand:+ start:399 stop:599 length:201 start_codon:yes stop_codon:yes gene_type:complete